MLDLTRLFGTGRVLAFVGGMAVLGSCTGTTELYCGPRTCAGCCDPTGHCETGNLPSTLATASVTVLDENRTLPVSNHVFVDSFDPFAVHVYQLAP